jgi:hypothetical protein
MRGRSAEQLLARRGLNDQLVAKASRAARRAATANSRGSSPAAVFHRSVMTHLKSRWHLPASLDVIGDQYDRDLQTVTLGYRGRPMKPQLCQKLVVRRSTIRQLTGLDLAKARGAGAAIAFDSEPASCVTKPPAAPLKSAVCAG